MDKLELITILLAVIGSLVAMVIGLVVWITNAAKSHIETFSSSIERSMDSVAHDVGEMKISIVGHFTELKLHKESTKEKFQETKERVDKLEQRISGGKRDKTI